MSFSWLCCQIVNLFFSYFIVHITLQLIRSIHDTTTTFSRHLRRRLLLRRVRYHVYPYARVCIRELEVCTICLGQRTDAVLQCGHVYHWECVSAWLDAKNTCPICRARQKRFVEHRME